MSVPLGRKSKCWWFSIYNGDHVLQRRCRFMRGEVIVRVCALCENAEDFSIRRSTQSDKTELKNVLSRADNFSAFPRIFASSNWNGN